MIITKLFCMFLIIVIIILIVNLLKVESFYAEKKESDQIEDFIISINKYISNIDAKDDKEAALKKFVTYYKDLITNLKKQCVILETNPSETSSCEKISDKDTCNKLSEYCNWDEKCSIKDTCSNKLENECNVNCKFVINKCVQNYNTFNTYKKKIINDLFNEARTQYNTISNIYNSYKVNNFLVNDDIIDTIKVNIQDSLTTQTIFSNDISDKLTKKLVTLQTQYENIKNSMDGQLNSVNDIKKNLNNWTEYLEEAVKTKSFENIVGLRSRHKPSIRIYFHTSFGNSDISIPINIKTKDSKDSGDKGYLIIVNDKFQNGALSSDDTPVFIVKKISNETEYKNVNENKKVNSTSYPFYLITTPDKNKIIAINKDFNTNYLELTDVNGKIYEQFDPIYD